MAQYISEFEPDACSRVGSAPAEKVQVGREGAGACVQPAVTVSRLWCKSPALSIVYIMIIKVSGKERRGYHKLPRALLEPAESCDSDSIDRTIIEWR